MGRVRMARGKLALKNEIQKEDTNVFIKHFQQPKNAFRISNTKRVKQNHHKHVANKLQRGTVKINTISLWCMNLSDGRHLMWSLTADSMACLYGCRRLR